MNWNCVICNGTLTPHTTTISNQMGSASVIENGYGCEWCGISYKKLPEDIAYDMIRAKRSDMAQLIERLPMLK